MGNTLEGKMRVGVDASVDKHNLPSSRGNWRCT